MLAYTGTIMGKRFEGTLAVAFVLFYQLTSAGIASASFFDWLVTEDSNSLVVQGISSNKISYSDNIWDFAKEVNKEPIFKVVSTYEVGASGYSSTPGQTDDSPFITASGKYVRDGIIAANFHVNGKRVAFGTKVRIPKIYGDKIFVVEDRMNSRYTNNIDIWFPETQLAREFGRKTVTIEIVDES